MEVLNKRTDKISKDAVYVGRPSKWGNPFVIGKHGNRDQVITDFTAYAELKLLTNPHWLDELMGKDLVCWCSPLPCHADVLIELANKDIATVAQSLGVEVETQTHP